MVFSPPISSGQYYTHQRHRATVSCTQSRRRCAYAHAYFPAGQAARRHDNAGVTRDRTRISYRTRTGRSRFASEFKHALPHVRAATCSRERTSWSLWRRYPWAGAAGPSLSRIRTQSPWQQPTGCTCTRGSPGEEADHGPPSMSSRAQRLPIVDSGWPYV